MGNDCQLKYVLIVLQKWPLCHKKGTSSMTVKDTLQEWQQIYLQKLSASTTICGSLEEIRTGMSFTGTEMDKITKVTDMHYQSN